ncbi:MULTISPECIES: hypothetical protein [unclassified Nostoc]|uniref:hypothetical protein n=1 Tax=unclassified Nostoc TaxID=2593658 RepID=UPI002AD4E585|nr:hypothetical protein [Nostoc sp. DedQUE03]MDZ7974040.1 hypothetical protein [Nostoc sp. DedQUE03]MDZ8048541.1 hypothetical protein [Nostoc sp. DedQUE02]
MTVTEIITHIERNFNRTQATGLNSLIFLALREQTTVMHQRKECGFDDIPVPIASWCDELPDQYLLAIATAINTHLLDELTNKSMFANNAQNHTVQAIEPQNQPSLLSDY